MAIYLAVIGVFGTILSVGLLVYQRIFAEKLKIAKRIGAVIDKPNTLPIRQQKLSAPLYQRVIKPAITALARFMPATRESILEHKLSIAGRPGNLSPRELMVIKYLLAGGGAVVFWLMAQFIDQASAVRLLLAIFGIFVGWMLPDIILNFKASSAKKKHKDSCRMY